jgi:hypothetical protein
VLAGPAVRGCPSARSVLASIGVHWSKLGTHWHGRYLYAIDPDAQKLYVWAVGKDGQLTPVGTFGGMPDTVAGLAAS